MDKTILCDDSIFGDPALSPEWSSAYTFSGENKYCLCLLGEGQSWNRSWTKCAEQGRNCSCPGGIVRYVFGPKLKEHFENLDTNDDHPTTTTSRTSTPTTTTSSTPTPATTTPAPATTKNFSWGNVTYLWDCTLCPPGSQANTECVDGKTNVTTNEIVKRNCTDVCKQRDDKLQCCICGGGVQNYYPPAQASCTT